MSRPQASCSRSIQSLEQLLGISRTRADPSLCCVQLVKYLIENYELSPAAVIYDKAGNLARLDAPEVS